MISSFSAIPLAITLTISFVDVSPSTERQLYVILTTSERAFWSISEEIAQSVVIKLSVVAILGWIIPLPLAIPPRAHLFPHISNSTATSFLTVSVVIIAVAAASLPVYESVSARGLTAFSIGSIGKICPITPVEATITSSGLIPSALAVSSHILYAFSSPSALQVLAFFELAITAIALPPVFSRLFFVTRIGAPFTLFCV